MKISDLIARLKGRDPESDITEADLQEQEVKTDEVVADTPEADKPEVSQEETVEAEVVQPADNSAEIEALKAKIAEMEGAKAEAEGKIADLTKANADLEAARNAADAKSRLDNALAEGWLLPAMLKEADDKDSVFVDMAQDQPELFDRLRLVMAPKSLPKKAITEAPAGGNDALTEEELVARIKALAKDKGISYAQAAQLV